VTLRILRVASDEPDVLRLAGRLAAAEVAVLERSVEAGLRALDLADLQSADEEGIAVLRRLRRRGVEIRNPSRYFELLLTTGPGD
jgi:ABC-type transporter Mla MlaB component